MLIPIISGGFNLAIIYTANMSGLTLAWVLNQHGGVDAGVWRLRAGGACWPSAWARWPAASWGW